MNLINESLPALYVVKVKELNSDEFNFLLNFADDYIKNRVKNLNLKNKKYSMVVANVLRKFLVFKHFSIPFEKQKIDFNESGKPYLNNQECYFNVSHSDDYVACVLAKTQIGVDIQKISKNKEKVSKFVFDKATNEKVNKAENQDLEFTKQWAKLESYLKSKGTGFVNYQKYLDENVKQQFFYIENYVISVTII